MSNPVEEIDDARVQRLWEDSLARKHGGYFKLWRMSRDDDARRFRGEACWEKDELLGVFPSREPCEAFLELLEHSPEVSYEFCMFDRGVDHIKGSWSVDLKDDGRVRTAGWQWCSSSNNRSYRHGKDRWSGYGRTKEEAIVNARAYMKEFEEFVRTERPRRAEGCYCQPNSTSPCGPCEMAVIKSKKKACGCPHCKGDHDT